MKDVCHGCTDEFWMEEPSVVIGGFEFCLSCAEAEAAETRPRSIKCSCGGEAAMTRRFGPNPVYLCSKCGAGIHRSQDRPAPAREDSPEGDENEPQQS